MDGTRSALIVAIDEYADPGLRRLRAPGSDARALAAVLRDPGIGGFEVRTLLNEPAHVVNLAVEEFFADRRPDDLLLVHFSCHGIKDEDGELYFAASNTVLGRLGATAVPAEFVSRRMSRGRSRRVVLLLDCCYAGAFERSLVTRAGAEMGIEQQFGGRGRAVITASNAMEYAFEASELADIRETPPSVFTSALVQGLETGEADRDQDGLVGLDELYDYVYDQVRAATPNQTPGKWTFGMEGELYIARRARPVTTPAPLPPELQQAIDSPLAGIRAGAVQELAGVLRGRHAGMALAARLALRQLTDDDSRAVAAAAVAALGDHPPVPPQPAPPQLVLSASVIDLGRLPQHGQSPEQRVRIGNAGGGDLNARAATAAGWLKLRQVGDELVVAVDTSSAGQYEGTVTVDSDGGTATIRVRARVDPALSPSPMAVAAEPEPVPAIPEDAPPGAHQNAALARSSPAAAKAPPPPAATEPAPAIPVGRPVTRPTVGPDPPPAGAGDRVASPPGDDRAPVVHAPQPGPSRKTPRAPKTRPGRRVPRRLARIAVGAGIALAGLISAIIFIPGTPHSSPGPHVSSTVHSSPALTVPSISAGSFDKTMSAMTALRPLAALGKGNVAVLLPDTVTSARYGQFDAPYLTRALTDAGLSSSQFTVRNAQGSDQTELSDAQTAITNGATVLIVDPLDSGVGAQIETYAKSHGVAVIDYDRLTFGGSRQYFVSFNNVLVGTKIGQGFAACAAAWHVSKPNVLVMRGDPTDNNATLFAQGYLGVLDPFFASGKYVKVGQPAGTWDPAVALSEFQQNFIAHKNVNSVLTPNDATAAPVIHFLQTQGVKARTFPVTGQDATTFGLQNILAGYQCGTVYKPFYLEAQAAAALAIYVRAGKTPPASLVNGSTHDPETGTLVRSVLLTPTWVTTANMASTIVADKFVTVGQLCAGQYAQPCQTAGISS